MASDSLFSSLPYSSFSSYSATKLYILGERAKKFAVFLLFMPQNGHISPLFALGGGIFGGGGGVCGGVRGAGYLPIPCFSSISFSASSVALMLMTPVAPFSEKTKMKLWGSDWCCSMQPFLSL